MGTVQNNEVITNVVEFNCKKRELEIRNSKSIEIKDIDLELTKVEPHTCEIDTNNKEAVRIIQGKKIRAGYEPMLEACKKRREQGRPIKEVQNNEKEIG